MINSNFQILRLEEINPRTKDMFLAMLSAHLFLNVLSRFNLEAKQKKCSPISITMKNENNPPLHEARKRQDPKINLLGFQNVETPKVIPISLRNGHNWCYLNSVFQAVRNIKPIAKYISSFPLQYVSATTLPGDAQLGFNFIRDFQKIESELNKSEGTSAELSASMECIRTSSGCAVAGSGQQDGHELLIALMSSFMSLHNTLIQKPSSDTNYSKLQPLESTVCGTSEERAVCQKCFVGMEKEDIWRCLSLPVTKSSDIAELLESRFAGEELLNGTESVYCTTCGCKTPTLMSNSLSHGPEVLILQLPNAEFVNGEIRKGNYTVQTPKKLGMVGEDNTVYVYELSAALAHLGEHTYSGHYVANCFHSDETCLRSDDDHFYEFSPHHRDVSLIYFCRSDEMPYVLFYTFKAKDFM